MESEEEAVRAVSSPQLGTSLDMVIMQTSQECLRKLFGRNFIHLNSLQRKLGCRLEVDIDNGILAAYSTPENKCWVETSLKNMIDATVKELGDQVEEAEYIGGTRVVVGAGYEVQEILFPLEFNRIIIRGLHRSVTKSDLNNHFEKIGISSSTVQSLDLTPYPTNQTAFIRFTSKHVAKDALEMVQKVPFKGRKLDASHAGLGPKKGVTQSEVCRLKLSWSLGKSEKKANVSFHTAAEANNFIEGVGNLIYGAKISAVHGEVVGSFSRHTSNPNSKKQPPAIQISGVTFGTCRHRFIVGDVDGQDTFDYKVTVVGLPAWIDEQEICRRVKPSVPKWVKVERKMADRSKSNYANGQISKFELAKKLAPLKEHVAEAAYKHFYLDKTLARGTIFIDFDDKVGLEKASKIHYCPGERPFGQPYRLEIEYNHNLSVHTELFPFIQREIEEVKELAYKKGADIRDRRNVENKFIFIRFQSCNANLIRQLQEKLENIASYSKFKHEKLPLLASSLGKIVLDKVRKTTFLSWNPKNFALYIYGSKAVQEKTKQRLCSEIEKLSSIQVVDRTLNISKTKLNLDGGNGTPEDVARIREACQEAEVDHYQFNGNRILVSGTEEAFSKLKTALEKDNLLFAKEPSQLSKFVDPPECIICTAPADPDFVRSSLCPHAFCVDCIQPFFDMMPPPFPVKCQGENCEMMMAIGDMNKVAKKEALKTVLELAVVRYQQQHPTEVLLCPKPDCGQLLCPSNKTTGEYGGSFYFCDECVATYCLGCSRNAEKPIKSHELESCEDARYEISDEVQEKVKTIQETIFNLACPRCAAVFGDFDGCAALTCGNGACKTSFCGLCLKDCGGIDMTHSHVLKCPKNPALDFFVSKTDLGQIHREVRIENLSRYLQSNQELAPEIVRAIKRDLIDLGIEEKEII